MHRSTCTYTGHKFNIGYAACWPTWTWAWLASWLLPLCSSCGHVMPQLQGAGQSDSELQPTLYNIITVTMIYKAGNTNQLHLLPFLWGLPSCCPVAWGSQDETTQWADSQLMPIKNSQREEGNVLNKPYNTCILRLDNFCDDGWWKWFARRVVILSVWIDNILTCIGLLEKLRALSNFSPFKCSTSLISTTYERVK